MNPEIWLPEGNTLERKSSNPFLPFSSSDSNPFIRQFKDNWSGDLQIWKCLSKSDHIQQNVALGSSLLGCKSTCETLNIIHEILLKN